MICNSSPWMELEFLMFQLCCTTSAIDSCLSILDTLLHVSKLFEGSPYLDLSINRYCCNVFVLNFVKSIASDGKNIIGIQVEGNYFESFLSFILFILSWRDTLNIHCFYLFLFFYDENTLNLLGFYWKRDMS